LEIDKDEVHKTKKYETKKPKIKLSDFKLKKIKSKKLIEIKNKDLNITLNENKNDLKFILSIAWFKSKNDFKKAAKEHK
tara:strand:- start:194 stop:430 length:237 start_codon:yes stop_codon:yes gene_type:complete